MKTCEYESLPSVERGGVPWVREDDDGGRREQIGNILLVVGTLNRAQLGRAELADSHHVRLVECLLRHTKVAVYTEEWCVALGFWGQGGKPFAPIARDDLDRGA